MMKYDKTNLVQEKIVPLLDEVYELCNKNDIPFFSFVMSAADEEKEATDWISSRMIPDFVTPDISIPDSLWSLIKISATIIKGS